MWENNTMKQVHVYIKGDVVGVGFRAWTKIQAKLLDIKGWVRNVHNRPETFGPSGGVEALFQGEDEKVDEIVKLVTKGPPVARVDEIETFPQEAKELLTSFEIVK
jgi:acylphosphatase